MLLIYIVTIISFLFTVWLIYMSMKYSNPYKLIMVFGKKGAGKTTYLCKLTQQYLKKGRPVYSTCDIPGAYRIQGTDVGNVQFPPESVILMDEVGMLYDNRNWKNGNMTSAVRDYFKLQRHYRHTVYLFSQAWDIDVKLRNLTDSMYLLINYFGFFTVGKQIKRRIVVVKPSQDCESRIADELVISPFLMTPFGARIFVYIPHWCKLFDSHEAPALASREYDRIAYPEGVTITKRGTIRYRNRKKERPFWTRVQSLGNLMPGALWAALLKRPSGQEPAPEPPLENDVLDRCGAGTEGPLDY